MGRCLLSCAPDGSVVSRLALDCRPPSTWLTFATGTPSRTPASPSKAGRLPCVAAAISSGGWGTDFYHNPCGIADSVMARRLSGGRAGGCSAACLLAHAASHKLSCTLSVLPCLQHTIVPWERASVELALSVREGDSVFVLLRSHRSLSVFGSVELPVIAARTGTASQPVRVRVHASVPAGNAASPCARILADAQRNGGQYLQPGRTMTVECRQQCGDDFESCGEETKAVVSSVSAVTPALSAV